MFFVKFKIINQLSYRRAMQVHEAYCYNRNHYIYAICPRCKIPLEREYQAYCDRCGQALKWKHFDKLRIKYVH